jgi:RimJ/RimL family protein N-acetyltransferase
VYHLAVVDMPITPLQADLVAMLEAMRRAERALFDDVPPEARERPGAIGEWSVKDVRAHLAAWRAIEAAAAEGRHRFIYAFPAVANAASNAVCAMLGFERMGSESLEYPPGTWMECAVWRRELGPALP